MYRFLMRGGRAEIQVVGYAANWIENEGNNPGYGQLTETLRCLREMIDKIPPYVAELDLRINCLGGSSVIATGLIKFLRQSRFRVVSSVEGVGISAGGTLSQAGHWRRMTSGAVIMFHPSVSGFEVSSLPGGIFTFTPASLRSYADAADRETADAEDIFVARSGLTRTKIRELYGQHLNASEALELGLIDEVFDGPPLPLPADTNQHALNLLAPHVEAALARRSQGQSVTVDN